MKTRAAVALGLALGLLGLFVLAVGWEDVFAAASRASLPIYALAFATSAFTLVARSYVWHLVLGVVDRRRPYWLVGSVFLTSMFAKYVTPYGQVATGVGMAAVVSRYYESTYEESLAAIVSADFLNYVPYYTFGAVGLASLLVFRTPSIDLTGYLLAVLAFVGVILLVLLTLWTRRGLVRATILGITGVIRGAVARISPRRAQAIDPESVLERLDGFYLTVELLSRDRRTMLTAVLYGHAAWLGLAGTLYLSALAVGVSLPVGVVLLSVALSKMGFLVPTPGGVGGVEIALAAVLYLVSPMGGALATAVAILYRFATYWFTVVVGGGTSIALSIADPLPP